MHVSSPEEQHCSDLLSVRLGNLAVSCFPTVITLHESVEKFAAVLEVVEPERAEAGFELWDSYWDFSISRYMISFPIV